MFVVDNLTAVTVDVVCISARNIDIFMQGCHSYASDALTERNHFNQKPTIHDGSNGNSPTKAGNSGEKTIKI